MIYICGPCVERHGVGLIADLIQVQAIKDIQRLFPDYTLIRQHLPSRSRHLRTVFGVKGVKP